jgi:hypothetical protein
VVALLRLVRPAVLRALLKVRRRWGGHWGERGPRRERSVHAVGAAGRELSRWGGGSEERGGRAGFRSPSPASSPFAHLSIPDTTPSPFRCTR